MSGAQPYDSIDALGIRSSIASLLGRGCTVEALASMTAEDLLRIHGIGPTKLAHIRQRLELHGYRLEDDEPRKLAPSVYQHPAHALVDALSQRYNAHDAEILADWCEERSLDGAAAALRAGPSAACRAQIEALAVTMGVRAPSTLVWWRRGWHPVEVAAQTSETNDSDDEKPDTWHRLFRFLQEETGAYAAPPEVGLRVALFCVLRFVNDQPIAIEDFFIEVGQSIAALVDEIIERAVEDLQGRQLPSPSRDRYSVRVQGRPRRLTFTVGTDDHSPLRCPPDCPLCLRIRLSGPTGATGGPDDTR